MELDLYFKPVPEKIAKLKTISQAKERLADIQIHTGNEKITVLPEVDMAIIGIEEDRIALNKGTANAPNEIRKHLYKLYKPDYDLKIVDLGNLSVGKTVKDTYFALKDTVIFLRERKVIPVIIGGSQDLTYPIYDAYRKLDDYLDIVIVDSVFDLGNAKKELNSESYISKIAHIQNNKVFNLSVLAYQNYLVGKRLKDRMQKLLFDSYRLGAIQQNITEIEPILRNAHFLSFDMRAIKQGDSPAHYSPSPNGLTAQEACQIAKYAGLSDKLNTFGLFEMNPLFDRDNQSAQLAAQIIWHYIEGVYERTEDFPLMKSDAYKKFIVNIDSVNQDLIFYKSIKTDRWWIEIPLTGKTKKLVSCSYNDYLSAGKQEIPDIWWKTFQKLNR